MVQPPQMGTAPSQRLLRVLHSSQAKGARLRVDCFLGAGPSWEASGSACRPRFDIDSVMDGVGGDKENNAEERRRHRGHLGHLGNRGNAALCTVLQLHNLGKCGDSEVVKRWSGSSAVGAWTVHYRRTVTWLERNGKATLNNSTLQ